MCGSISRGIVGSILLLTQIAVASSFGQVADRPTGRAHLVADINQTPRLNRRGSNINRMIRAGDLVFFLAATAQTGAEIWRTDGTAKGTFLPKETWPGPASGPDAVGWWEAQGVLFFSSRVDVELELWRSDGTRTGTYVVKRLPAGFTTTIPIATHQPQASLFYSDDPETGTFQIWRTDGTESGTVPVKTGFNPSAGKGVWVNGVLFFAAHSAEGSGLWKSDGTQAGTVLVKGGCGDEYSDVLPWDLVAMNDRVYYSDDDCGLGAGLYTSDGTEAGTYMLKAFEPNGSWDSPSISQLTAVGGALYFRAYDSTHGLELWKSDGSAAGTVFVKDIADGPAWSYPASFTELGGKVFFSAAEDDRGGKLWKTDGTEQGTVLVKDIPAGSPTASDGWLYFAATDGVHGLELWRSDGSEAGTTLLKDINPGSARSLGENMLELNGIVLFDATDPVHGEELWKSDGTDSGTVLVKDVNPALTTNGSVFIPGPVALGQDLFFIANDGVHGSDLWKSDGTSGGTTLVKDFVRPSMFYARVPMIWMELDGKIVMETFDPIHGNELWSSDGTEAGTVLVKDINPGVGDSFLQLVGVLDGVVYFAASDGGPHRSLWKSDLTEAGTVRVTEGLASCADSVVLNGTLFFSGDDSMHGCELWKIEGNAGEPQMVKDIRPAGVGGYPPAAFLQMNGRIFFVVDDGVHGLEIWTSDGTEAGTEMVKDVFPGPAGSIYTELIAIDGRLYFNAENGTDGVELWVSDGTEAGTRPFLELAPGHHSLFPQQLASVGGKLMFTSYGSQETGQLLWSSDGTPAGTAVVAEGLLDIAWVTTIDDVLYFPSNLSVHSVGSGLWRSDGTARGTTLVQIINHCANGISASGAAVVGNLTKVGRRLFFFADDGSTGMEPWVGWAAVLANRRSQAIADLRAEVNALHLPPGASRFLLATLDAAERGLEQGNVHAVAALDAFVLRVEMQTPRFIPAEAAADLVEFARQIIGLVSQGQAPVPEAISTGTRQAPAFGGWATSSSRPSGAPGRGCCSGSSVGPGGSKRSQRGRIDHAIVPAPSSSPPPSP